MSKKKILIIATLLVLIVSMQTVFGVDLLPTGGDEPDYDPDAWTDTATLRSNCYTYAVLQLCVLESDKFLMQPGYFAGDTYTFLTESSIVKAVKADIAECNPIDGDFYETTADAVPPEGYRKVALVISPFKDYHWYMQNSDGYWSHKQGIEEVTNVDASGDLIADPATCDRNYSNVTVNSTGLSISILNYSTFCGYYMVR